MIQERLLERLRHIESDPEYRGVPDPNRIIASIMNHLQKILNTRQGSAPIDDNYGVPDFTDLAVTFSSESVRDLSRAIKAVINNYEPRLSNVQIAATPQGDRVLELHFKIEGRLNMGNNMDMPVSFETVVDPDGRIQVNR
ncbi:MAG: type VI secretion system baseplate subunit TssE [Deltaproteobacteria bacterium]|nr:type VI secretion system baseplate subunit TssE [Deltaproteobacteria bacterium]